LALQADVLALTALIGIFAWDLWAEDWNHKTPLIVAVALLYGGMRRKMVVEGRRNYVAPGYSWAASLLLLIATFDIFSDPWIAPVLAALGLALFEVGRSAGKGFLRWQGFLLITVAFFELIYNLPTYTATSIAHVSSSGMDAFSLTKSLLLEATILAAVGYWLLERTRDSERCTKPEHIVGLGANALGTISIAAWFACRFPSTWVPVPGGEAWVTAIWAAMATLLLVLAWLVRRRAFLVQAVALVVAVLARAFFIDLPVEAPAEFWQGPLFHLGMVALILLAALPIAYKLRGGEFWVGSTLQLPADLGVVLLRPEQWFFFAAFALEVVALAVKLSSGHITIAWSLLGLGVFLFALAVGERSFRLAGLGLLLVSVVKILLMDVWALSPSDRYTTLIVLGLALLAVSFLYTRFSAVIRRYL
jgi:hypothetical protein